MSALPLNPHDTNYLSCRLVNEQLSDNKMSFESISDDVREYPGFTPKITLDGTGRISFSGAFEIISNPAAGMTLATLPEILSPVSDVLTSTAVIRGSDAIFNALAVESETFGIESITITNAGTYSSDPLTGPSVSIGVPGEGAVGLPLLGAKSATVPIGQGNLFVPGTTLTLNGGQSTSPGTFTVTTTKLSGTGAVVAGGTGGTPGPVILTGTTGTGTKFQVEGLINGSGVLSSLPAGIEGILVAGAYTVNPTNLAAEPVTGGGLTGATIGIIMGPGTLTLSNSGSYSTFMPNPVETTDSGTGLNASIDVVWKVVGVDILDSGNGYSVSSPVTFSGGVVVGSDVATGTVVLEVNSKGDISLINAPQVGDIIYLDNINFIVKPYF